MRYRRWTLVLALAGAALTPNTAASQASAIPRLGPRPHTAALAPRSTAGSRGSRPLLAAVHTPAHRRTPGLRGAVLGAVIGAGVGTFLAIGFCDVPHCATQPDTWAIIGGSMGLGTLLGFAIDGLFWTRQRHTRPSREGATPPARSRAGT